MRDFTPRNHIAGRDYSTCIRGALLDDRRIDHYIRQGLYGSERRNALIAEETAAKRAKPVRRLSSIQRVLAKLSL